MNTSKALDIVEKAIDRAYESGRNDTIKKIVEKLLSFTRWDCDIQHRYDTGNEIEWDDGSGDWIKAEDIDKLIKELTDGIIKYSKK